MDGAYAHMRQPQCPGLFLAIFGEGIVHWPTLFSLAAFPVIVLAYVSLARPEERQMLVRYGKVYAEYRRLMPTFIPRPRAWCTLARSVAFWAHQPPAT